MSPRPVVIAVVAALAVLMAPGAASAASTTPKRLRTKIVVKKFVVSKTGLSALGSASTNVGKATRRQAVVLKASTGSTCQVLTLRLDRLNLALLGLRLDVSAVNLRITGNRARTLGALFCKLSKATRLGKIATARATAASLNSRLRGRPLQMIGFNAMLYPQTVNADGTPQTTSGSARSTRQQAPLGPTCPVLDLTLGPLNLDLLGLVVDLYGKTRTDPVRVTAVADPAAGILGKALCQISTQQPS